MYFVGHLVPFLITTQAIAALQVPATARVTIEYDSSHRAIKQHSVYINIEDPAAFDGVVMETNPFMIWIFSDGTVEEGSFYFYSSAYVSHPEVEGNVIMQYWEFDINKENLHGTLVEDYRLLDSLASNMVWAEHEGSAFTREDIWPYSVHEGATIDGKLGSSGVDLTVAGTADWIYTHIAFEIHILSSTGVDLSKYGIETTEENPRGGHEEQDEDDYDDYDDYIDYDEFDNADSDEWVWWQW